MKLRFYIEEEDEEIEVPDNITQKALDDMFDKWVDGHLLCGYTDVSGSGDEIYKDW